MKTHTYSLEVEWTGNRGSGTSGYRAYDRACVVRAAGKPDLSCSSDPAFLGSPECWNPEELLLASLSVCHKLWFLHLCAEAGVVVETYADAPTAVMIEQSDGSGRFQRAELRPLVGLRDESLRGKLPALHAAAHEKCFIARSVNFDVVCLSE